MFLFKSWKPYPIILQKNVPEVTDGKTYHLWPICMETYFETVNLWEIVEEEIDTTLREDPTMAQLKAQKVKKIKKSKAKVCLFALV